MNGVREGADMNGVREGADMNGVREGADMNGVLEGADVTDSPRTGKGTDFDAAGDVGDMGLDAAGAAAIMAEAGGRARDRLEPRHRASLAIFGVLYIFGYGLTWLILRGQKPFHGPAPAAFAATTLLAVVASLASVEEARSETGIRGLSAIRRRAFLISALAGYVAIFTLEGALDRAGASRPVLNVFEASAPILVIGLLYLARSVSMRVPDWPVAGLGLWLVIVAATSGYAGALATWAIDALAVGPAFLLVAALEPRLRRS